MIAFQEMATGLTASQISARLDSILPLGGGQQWTVHRGASDGFNRNALATRYSQSMQITDTTPASEVRGVTSVLADLPSPVYDFDLYAMAVHFKCCNSVGTETARRQQHSDAIASWLGDLRTAGGNVNIAASTPIIVLGDFNFVDSEPQQPEVTLRTGDIVDNSTYGADIQGDWDASDITDLLPSDPYTGDTDTWPTGTTNPTSRLDRCYYTDSVVSVIRKFVFNTRTMNTTQRANAGVQFFDSEDASDHLPIVFDLVVLPVPVTVSAFAID